MSEPDNYFGFELTFTTKNMTSAPGVPLPIAALSVVAAADRIVLADGTVYKDRYADRVGGSTVKGWPENATKMDWPSCKLKQEVTNPYALEKWLYFLQLQLALASKGQL